MVLEFSAPKRERPPPRGRTPSLSGFPIWRLSRSVTERMQDTQWVPPRGAGKSLFKCVQCLSLGRPGHGAVCSQFKYLKKTFNAGLCRRFLAELLGLFRLGLH